MPPRRKKSIATGDTGRPTMADLAALAGVSKITISRALRGSEAVHPETRERIKSLAREHGYRLNLSARNLRLQRNAMVAVVVEMQPSIERPMSEPYPLALLGGISQELTSAEYSILLMAMHELSPERLPPVDGVILLGQGEADEATVRIRELGVPVVSWGALRSGHGSLVVGSDNARGGELAAERLLSLGRRRVVYLGNTRFGEIADRCDGLKARLEVGGATLVECLDGGFTFLTGANAIRTLLSAGTHHFDGIFACSDLVAMGAIRALTDAGVDVPGDVAVVGFDDTPMASYFVPALTTIRQDWHHGGLLLARKLLSLVQGEAAQSEIMPVNLIVRSS